MRWLSKMIKYSMIACIDKSRGLGYKNNLLFSSKKDLARFKKVTNNKIVIMGRKTAESIVELTGSLLPNRFKLILTRDGDFTLDGITQEDVQIYNDLDSLFYGLNLISNKNKSEGVEEEVVIIGGQQIYEHFLPFTSKIYLTNVINKFKQVDTFFPEIDPKEWELQYYQRVDDEGSKYPYNFTTYNRKGSFYGTR